MSSTTARRLLVLLAAAGCSPSEPDQVIASALQASAPRLLPAIRYVGRRRDDPSGVMSTGEATVKVSQYPQRGTGRWGDYSAMTVDPVDDCTFYYTNEYVASPASSGFGLGTWGTRIASFRFPGCGGVPHGRSCLSFTRPRLDVEGIAMAGRAAPPDPVGDVGQRHYVQAANGPEGAVFAVFDKETGARLADPRPLSTLAAGDQGCRPGLGDPLVLWDQLAGRWLLSEISRAGKLCLYLSRSADPLDEPWTLYAFATPGFPDYAKLGVHADTRGRSAYLATTFESVPTVYAFDRPAMLRGEAARFVRLTAEPLPGFEFQSLTPAHLEGGRALPAGAPALFLRHRDDELHGAAGGDALEMFLLDFDFVTDGRSRLEGPIRIPVAPFDSAVCGRQSGPCLRQPGAATRLDAFPEVIMWRLGRRNHGGFESLVGSFVTAVAPQQAGIRWFELRNHHGRGWTLYQEGTLAPDAASRWLGSVAMDGDGNIALGYSAVSSDSPVDDPYEPNDDVEHATAITCGFVSESAALQPEGDVDVFRLRAPAGAAVVLDVDARTDSSPVDAALVVRDRGGKLLAYNDDAIPPGQPPGPDPYLRLEVPADGELTVSVQAVSSSGPYTLSVRCEQ